MPVPLEAASLPLANMVTTTNNASRPMAVLKLPKNQVPFLITYARSILQAMTNNPAFSSPIPPVAALEAAIVALANAEAATLTGLKGTVAERDQKRMELKMLLEQLCSYVQATADADPDRGASIIESAGMAVKNKAGPAPRAFAAKRGPVSGSVLLIAPKAGNRAAYEWQDSTDGMKTWVSLPVTVQATTTVHGLSPGSTVYFRYRTVTKDGASDWSDPVSKIVD
jgi:hypothetical protein